MLKQTDSYNIDNLCYISYSVDLEKQFASQDIVCNEARINGEFYFGGSNPILQNFFGSNSLFGHGKARIKFGRYFLIIYILYYINYLFLYLLYFVIYCTEKEKICIKHFESKFIL